MSVIILHLIIHYNESDAHTPYLGWGAPAPELRYVRGRRRAAGQRRRDGHRKPARNCHGGFLYQLARDRSRTLNQPFKFAGIAT